MEKLQLENIKKCKCTHKESKNHYTKLDIRQKGLSFVTINKMIQDNKLHISFNISANYYHFSDYFFSL